MDVRPLEALLQVKKDIRNNNSDPTKYAQVANYGTGTKDDLVILCEILLSCSNHSM